MSEQYISRETIEAKSRELLAKVGALRVPVPLEIVAHALDLSVEAAALGNDVSGVLVLNGGKGAIGYNEDQAEVRQRFTIAHEIGHFQLHATEENIFIDKTYIYNRNHASSTGENRREIQANLFASALLMPEELVMKEIEEIDFDLEDETALRYLAGRFNVSVQAMSFRLAKLGVFSDLEMM